MVFVTTGMSGNERQVVMLGNEDEVLIRLTPDDARRMARKLIEKVHQIENPKPASEWP